MLKKSKVYLLILSIVFSVGLNTNIAKASTSKATKDNIATTKALGTTISTSSLAKAPGYSNPLITQKFGADPYAMVYNERVYIYMSSDAFEYDTSGNITNNTYSNIKTITCISSDDMVNWTDHGEISVAGSTGAAKWANNSWAPAVTHKTINGKEKFFMYFANNGGSIGVLTSDSPIGPWIDPIGKPIITNSTPGVSGVVWLFDPAVLVDDDGNGYLYFGGGIPGGSTPTQSQIANPKTARVIKLGTDMISTVGSASVIDSPFMFEDSGIHKYNGKYYYSYCSNFSGTHPTGTPPMGEIAYMVSDNPMGPFTYKGTFLKNPSAYFEVGGNNHHAVFNFKNQWYVTYHAQTLGKSMGIVKGYRSPHINKLSYNSSGLINMVQADMKGVAQVQNVYPYKRIEAETIAWSNGISTEKCLAAGDMVSSINLDVTNINNGDWSSLSNVNFTNGVKSFTANVASTVGGSVEVHLDSLNGQLIGTLNVSPTGGEQQWKQIWCGITNVTGVHNVYFKFVGTSNSQLFNIDYLGFIY